MKTNQVTEDGIYILKAGKLISVWIRATRLDGNKHLHLWRDVMDWNGNVYKPEELEAYEVTSKLNTTLPNATIQSYV